MIKKEQDVIIVNWQYEKRFLELIFELQPSKKGSLSYNTVYDKTIKENSKTTDDFMYTDESEMILSRRRGRKKVFMAFKEALNADIIFSKSYDGEIAIGDDLGKRIFIDFVNPSVVDIERVSDDVLQYEIVAAKKRERDYQKYLDRKGVSQKETIELTTDQQRLYLIRMINENISLGNKQISTLSNSPDEYVREVFYNYQRESKRVPKKMSIVTSDKDFRQLNIEDFGIKMTTEKGV